MSDKQQLMEAKRENLLLRLELERQRAEEAARRELRQLRAENRKLRRRVQA